MGKFRTEALIRALRLCGWSDERIAALVVFIETREEKWLEKVVSSDSNR